ncbi:MAG TPA: hypothetical protein VEY12_02370 [Thermoplasmata archaeon]|nr:hypothetical protein [Thermoplasmata archaeon]
MPLAATWLWFVDPSKHTDSMLVLATACIDAVVTGTVGICRRLLGPPQRARASASSS